MIRPRKRRQHGTGSVYRRKDGRYVGTIEAGYTARGTRRRITVTARTEAAARDKLKAKQRQVAAEGAPAEVSARTTVKAWSELWLAMTVTILRPRPWATDRSALRRWVVPTIGHRRLEQLTPADIRAVTQAQRTAGRSTSTAHRTHGTLLTMLRAAVVEGHQVPPRVFAVKPPALAVSDRTAMTTLEAIKLLRAASYLPHGSRWAMAFLHGVRQAEALGLTWPAVDLDAGPVTIEWQLQTLPYNVPRDRTSGFRIPDGYEVRHLVEAFHLVRPKTKKGFRVTPLVPAMREALREWREVSPANEWDLVWPEVVLERRGRTLDVPVVRPVDDKHDREEWYELQRQADVRHPSGRFYYPHEARHTTATQLLEDGVDPHVITMVMGHSSILTTRGYQHPGQRPALNALESIAGRLEIGR